MHIRTASPEDIFRLIKLYKAVARQEGGIARAEDEVTEAYVAEFLNKSLDHGLIIVAEHPENPEELIGAIHAYKPGPRVFEHIFSHLTIAVDPSFQGKKIGRTLFTIFLEEVGLNRSDIGRVELIVRESNHKAIKFYQSFGFQIEGRFEMRVKTPRKTYEADIPMMWQNPNYEFD